MLAVFNRLTRDDEVPRTESIHLPSRWQVAWSRSRRAVEISLAVPLVLGLLALVVFLAVSSASVSGCKPASGAPYVVAGNPVLACQTVQKSAAVRRPAG